MKKTIILIMLLVASLLFGYDFKDYSLRVTYLEEEPGVYYSGDNTENGNCVNAVRFEVTLPDTLFDEMVFGLSKHIVLRDYVTQGFYGSHIEIRKIEVITDSAVVLRTIFPEVKK